jgi:hypothetical protein
MLSRSRPPLWSSGQSSFLQIQRSGLDSWGYQIFWEVVGLERGPLSLVSTTEKLLGRKSSGSGLENREYGRRDPSRWPRGTFYPQKLAIVYKRILTKQAFLPEHTNCKTWLKFPQSLLENMAKLHWKRQQPLHYRSQHVDHSLSLYRSTLITSAADHVLLQIANKMGLAKKYNSKWSQW